MNGRSPRSPPEIRISSRHRSHRMGGSPSRRRAARKRRSGSFRREAAGPRCCSRGRLAEGAPPLGEGAPCFSPDGRWLAIESSESGRREIVVRDPGGEARVAISTDGGTRPRWSVDGRTIYFEADGRAMRAAFDPDRGAARASEAVAANAAGQVMAITPTGRILTLRMAAPTRAFVVLQWLRELRERLPQPTTSPR